MYKKFNETKNLKRLFNFDMYCTQTSKSDYYLQDCLKLISNYLTVDLDKLYNINCILRGNIYSEYVGDNERISKEIKFNKSFLISLKNAKYLDLNGKFQGHYYGNFSFLSRLLLTLGERVSFLDILMDKDNNLKFVMADKLSYGDNSRTYYVFEILFIPGNILLNEDSFIFKLLTNLNNKEKNYDGSGIFSRSYLYQCGETNEKKNFYSENINIKYFIDNNKHLINYCQIDNLSKDDLFKLKYFIIYKEDRLSENQPSYFNDRVKSICIESNFKVTNIQANILNHLLDSNIFLSNGDGSMFYNLKEKGIGWSHSRDWVKSQLGPFIKSGLINFKSVPSSRDNRYRIWYFFENNDVNNDLFKKYCTSHSNVRLKGWQSKFH